jgi:hypothetical protein
MNSPSPQPLGPSHAWKQFYRAALFESDRERIPRLIDQAEKAIVVRARELFQAFGDNAEEQEALEDAPYALHAFRSALGLRVPPVAEDA